MGRIEKVVAVWTVYASLSLVVTLWVETVDRMRADALREELEEERGWKDYYREKSNRVMGLWRQEVLLNDAIEKRFPNGLPPEKE